VVAQTAEIYTLPSTAGDDLVDARRLVIFDWVPAEGRSVTTTYLTTRTVDGVRIPTTVTYLQPGSAVGYVAFKDVELDDGFTQPALACSFSFTGAPAGFALLLPAPGLSWSWDPTSAALSPDPAPPWRPPGWRTDFMFNAGSVGYAGIALGGFTDQTELGRWTPQDDPLRPLRLQMLEGDDTAHGGAGGDTLEGGVGADRLLGGDSRDILRGGDSPGPFGRRELPGDLGDVMDGQRGNDILDGGAGADVLSGGSGDDYIVAGSGHDILFGSVGNDRLIGEDGNDRLIGGPGQDTAQIADRGDLVVDLVAGTARGASGADRLIEIEHVVAEGTTVLILGDAGDNRLEAGWGRDTITGGLGSDSLYGQQDDDRLTGGPGADHFLFGDFDWSMYSGEDVITDFRVDEGDRIDVSVAWLSGTPMMQQDGADTIVRIGMIDGSVRLLGVTIAELGAVDNWFVPSEEPEWLPH
jgi:Ca2+-binding RTX toxin-like protein